MTNKQTAANTSVEAFIVPLGKLERDPLNVRKTYSKDGIEELAATIRADGYRLLQNLVVRKAGKKGQFFVTAGGRRLAALQLLCEAGEIGKDYGVECKERGADDATEISLIENIAREDMHPVVQFEAYRSLAEEGKSVADIAARFGKTESFVRGRMALGRVSPVLLELYREEEMTFEQLKAFTLSDDHARQVEVWEDLPYYDRHASTIRRRLHTDSISAGDKRLKFIGGLEVYEAAGGAVKRDLFDDSLSGYATDAALVEKLVTDKLEAAAATLLSEGWKWVECVPALPNSAYSMDRVYAAPVPLSDEKQTELEALKAEYAALMEKYEAEEATDEDDARHDVVVARMDELDEQDEIYQPSDIERAGCYVFMDYYGELKIERGLIERSADTTDDEENDETDNDGEGSEDGHASGRILSLATVTPEPEPAFTLPAAFVQELSAQKTAAIRAELAYNPTVALATVVHAMLLPLYSGFCRDLTALEISLTSVSAESSIKDAADAKAIQTLDALTAEMKARLPENPAELWDYCLSCSKDDLLVLLAFAAAQSLNAIQYPHVERRKQRAHADQVATALGMDMRDWFTPNAANYFSRVSKKGIEHAVAEAKGADFAEGVSGMKKADAAAYAERQIAVTLWLPSQLRLDSDRSTPVCDDEPEAEDDFNDDITDGFSQAAE
ncbi:ParB family chromosome partitioning protein [Ochrobactrum anthropi]|uniref:ParB/RepB/Spo0J family partition protein n=1 Tax=Brucella anthropi TaxID=529 RepID=UPI0015FB9EBE|nr:ParB/RepB/Spo0J family partition protein [Brucella anthropi]MBA8862755.1 ParB family chromosome partitioning protein [Brucella anthropi]